MTVKPALQCRSLEGWTPVPVSSSSSEDKHYVVHVNPWTRSERAICECPSYTYRGYCKHQKVAWDFLCGWNEVEFPDDPPISDQQRADMECPRCGGPLMWAMWDEDETN